MTLCLLLENVSACPLHAQHLHGISDTQYPGTLAPSTLFGVLLSCTHSSSKADYCSLLVYTYVTTQGLQLEFQAMFEGHRPDFHVYNAD